MPHERHPPRPARRLPSAAACNCSTADVFRVGECLDYFPNRVADPTLIHPEMWND